MDQFDIGASRSHRFDGVYGMVGIIGRDDPNLEGTASRGCRPGRLYPNEKCLSHGPQYGMLAGARKWAVKPQRLLCYNQTGPTTRLSLRLQSSGDGVHFAAGWIAAVYGPQRPAGWRLVAEVPGGALMWPAPQAR